MTVTATNDKNYKPWGFKLNLMYLYVVKRMWNKVGILVFMQEDVRFGSLTDMSAFGQKRTFKNFSPFLSTQMYL